MPDRKLLRRLERRPDTPEQDYEVGYGKPPVASRFQPGQSGNPKGRPRGAKNRANAIPALNEERMKIVVQEEAYRSISIRDGDRLVEIPMIQAVIRSVGLNAAKGHQGSQKMFTQLLQWVERENKALSDEFLGTAIEYKRNWDEILRHRERTGATAPEPLPHPDDIVINMHTGRVEIHGPMTKEDQARWNWMREAKEEIDDAIVELEGLLKENPDIQGLRDALAFERRMRAKICTVLPDKAPWELRHDAARAARASQDNDASSEAEPTGNDVEDL